MLQAYQGYFQGDVQLVSEKNLLIKIPVNKLITILWEEETNEVENNDERIKTRLAMVESLKGILPPDIDLEAARNERISRRGLMDE